MQAGQLTIVGYSGAGQMASSSGLEVVVRRMGGRLTRLFGCRHKEMSRPFSHQGQAYRTCVNCGAQKKFNLGSWEMQGDFYYRLPTSKYFRALNGVTSSTRSLHIAGAK